MNQMNISPLKNVTAFSELVDRVMSRPAHLPGMATFTGFSGYGKTYAAIYAANNHGAIHLEAGESWTRKKFCDMLLTELGTPTKGSIADKVDKIIEGLVNGDKPLIIDEFDFIVSKNFVELIREIHMKSETPIILIGEELLPSKLAEWERFHNRIISFVQASPADIDDAAHLAKLYCPDLEFSEDILKAVLKKSENRVRRVCVNLQQIQETADEKGLQQVNTQNIDVNKLYTGRSPTRRAA